MTDLPRFVRGTNEASWEYALIVRNMSVKGQTKFMCVGPRTGLQEKLVDAKAYIKGWWVKSTPEEARKAWTEVYKVAPATCGHVYGKSDCKKADCEFKTRVVSHCILSGLILPFWTKLKELGVDQSRICGLTLMNPLRRIVGMQIDLSNSVRVADKVKQGLDKPVHLQNLSNRIPNDPFFKVLHPPRASSHQAASRHLDVILTHGSANDVPLFVLLQIITTFETRACTSIEGRERFNFQLHTR